MASVQVGPPEVSLRVGAKAWRRLFIISLISILVALYGCRPEIKPQTPKTNQLTEAFGAKIESNDEYWFDVPDGRRIVCTPVDSLIVVEFADDVSIARKKEIVEELHKKNARTAFRQLAPIYVPENFVWILEVGKNDSRKIQDEAVQNYPNEIEGILPAFNQKGSSRLSVIWPTTFEVVFYCDVHQDSAMALLKRYDLTLPPHWAEEHFFPFYVMRLASVIKPRNQKLFEVIQALAKEPEVYSAHPLFAGSGYALRHGPAPYANFPSRRKVAHFEKLGGPLSDCYWLIETAPIEILSNHAAQSGLTIRGDSVAVVFATSPMAQGEFPEFLAGMGVQNINDKDGVTTYTNAWVHWKDLDRLVAHDKVKAVDPYPSALQVPLY